MSEHVLAIAVWFAYSALAIALVACFLRVLRGPSMPDRVLAGDLMNICGAALLAVMGIAFDSSMLLDVALILIVTGFVATAAFAQFLERRYRRRDYQATDEDQAALRGYW